MDLISLRREIRKQRQNLPEAVRRELATEICQRIIETQAFQQSQTVALYYPQNGEVDVLQLLKIFPQKQFYLPILNPDGTNSLIFGRYANDTILVNNKFAIPEPDANITELIETKDIDLVITPIVLFDDKCNRVGMGAGYYDRTFAFKITEPAKQPFLLGVAYEFQKTEGLIANPWDVRMQKIVTEENII
jgi:5-formyltetrahydrofolate cyclo-ligase